MEAGSRPAPSIVLHHLRRPAVPHCRLDSEEWQKFESRGARHRCRRAARPPRCLVPIDLVGKCFNCFSTAHTADRCHQRTWCFRCKSLGHRSSVCPGLTRAGPLARRVSVWRRVRAVQGPAIAAFPQRHSLAGLACGAADRAAAPRRVSVWRHISPMPMPVDAAPSQRSLPAGVACVMAASAQQGSSAAMAHGSGVGSDARPGKRRRRRPRFR